MRKVRGLCSALLCKTSFLDSGRSATEADQNGRLSNLRENTAFMPEESMQ